VAQTVPSKHEALSSNPSTGKKKKKQGRRRKQTLLTAFSFVHGYVPGGGRSNPGERNTTIKSSWYFRKS
jgi:hypothetical protein